MHVLTRVGVATWSDCPEDAAFLQAELLECLRPTGATTMTSWLMLIGGLVAFLLYCRVVLFDRIDDSSKAGKAAMANRLPPRCTTAGVNQEALQCPITLELMTDPVTEQILSINDLYYEFHFLYLS